MLCYFHEVTWLLIKSGETDAHAHRVLSRHLCAA